MPDRDPRKLAAWGAAALALVLLTAWYLARSGPADSAAAPPVATIAVAREDGGSGDRLIVDVAGAVHRPGVYRMASGARVEDALKRAGGATPHADLSQINRAAKLEDGRQVLVPRRASRAAAASAPATAAAAPSPPLHLHSPSTSAPPRSSNSTRSTASARRRRKRSSTSARRTADSAPSTNSTRSP